MHGGFPPAVSRLKRSPLPTCTAPPAPSLGGAAQPLSVVKAPAFPAGTCPHLCPRRCLPPWHACACAHAVHAQMGVAHRCQWGAGASRAGSARRPSHHAMPPSCRRRAGHLPAVVPVSFCTTSSADSSKNSSPHPCAEERVRACGQERAQRLGTARWKQLSSFWW